MDNQKNTQKNRISELIESSLGSIRELVDANTIIGTPLQASAGTTIIPISKVSLGFAGGGNDYAGKHSMSVGKNNFGGGGGTGVSVTPVGFLIIDADGQVEMLNISNPTGASELGNSIENIVEKAPDIIAKIKAIFSSKKKKKDGEDADADSDPVVETSEDAAENSASESEK